MNKQTQLKVLKEEFHGLKILRSYSIPDDFMPETKPIIDAIKKAEALNRKIEAFNTKRSDAWRKIFLEIESDRRKINRAIAFEKPIDALKKIDDFKKKYAKYYGGS